MTSAPQSKELAGEGRHGMAAISENCAEVPKQDARGQVSEWKMQCVAA